MAATAAAIARLSPFSMPESPDRATIDCEGRQGRTFAAERAEEAASVFDAAAAHIRGYQYRGEDLLDFTARILADKPNPD